MKISLIVQLRSGAKLRHSVEAPSPADAIDLVLLDITRAGSIENINKCFLRFGNAPFVINVSAIEAIYEDISAA